jgi:hypothetical protein
LRCDRVLLVLTKIQALRPGETIFGDRQIASADFKFAINTKFKIARLS